MEPEDGPDDAVKDPPPPPKPPKEEWAPRDLKAEAKSITHLLTHMPMNPYCEVCQRAKMSRRPA